MLCSSCSISLSCPPPVSTVTAFVQSVLFSPGAMLPSAIWMHPMPYSRDRREISAYLALYQLPRKVRLMWKFLHSLSLACSIISVFYLGVFRHRRVSSPHTPFLRSWGCGVFSHRRIQSPAYSVTGVFSHRRFQLAAFSVSGVFSHQCVSFAGVFHLPA